MSEQPATIHTGRLVGRAPGLPDVVFHVFPCRSAAGVYLDGKGRPVVLVVDGQWYRVVPFPRALHEPGLHYVELAVPVPEKGESQP